MFFNQNNVKTFVSNLQYQSYLDDHQLKFLEEIFESGQLKKRKESVNYFEIDNGFQVNLGNELLPREIQILQNRENLQIILPIMSVRQNFTNMVLLAFKLPKD